MVEFLEITVDKFTFKVATARLYNEQGVWAKMDAGLVRVGLSDFVQQRSGDVAFAEIEPVGTQVTPGDDLATIETIKVNISLPSPVAGEIIEINPGMVSAPESINQDPFGAGWLAVIKATDWEIDKSHLLNPEAYLAKMKLEAENEVKKP
jgi:glycine cleavage system H protein